MLIDTNPYVVIDWDALGVAKTQAIWNSVNPYFQATLQFKFPEDVDLPIDDDNSRFDLRDLAENLPKIRISVYSRNRSISDDLLGMTLLEPSDLLERTLISMRPHSTCPIEIYGNDGSITGYVDLKTYTVIQ